MFICLVCKSALVEKDQGFRCARCSYRADREDGIVHFGPTNLRDGDGSLAEGLDTLCQVEERHFWFRHRLKVIRQAFRDYVGPEKKILDVGARTGLTARALCDDGYRDISLGDIHTKGLQHAKRYGFDQLYRFDVRCAPFVDHFDAVGLFDVIEHIQDDALVVRNLHTMLRPDGLVLLTVPAHRWLWSRVDALSGHYRRYDRQSVATLLTGNGFDLVECRYFFIALVPALLVRSLLARHSETDRVESDSGLTICRTADTILGIASSVGDLLLSPLRRTAGGSLLAVAKKRPATQR